MVKANLGVFGLVTLLLPLHAAAADWQLSLSSSRHADAVPLARLEDDDVARHFVPRSGRNLAYVRDELRLSRGSAQQSWSLLVRQNASVIAEADALDLARSLEASGGPTASRQWQVQARYQGFVGAGLEWERRFQWGPAWQASLGVQGLVLSQWRDFELNGPASFDAALGQWAFDLDYRRADSRLDFPFQRPAASRGAALLTHGSLRWAGESVSAELSWRDAGWLRWRDLPQQQAALSSSTRTVDGNGHVVYKPLVNGRFVQTNRRRSAPVLSRLALAWQLSPHTELGVASDHLQGFGLLPQVSVKRRWGDSHWGGRYEVHERRWGMEWAWRGLNLAYAADRLGGDTRSRRWLVSYQRPWL